MNNMKLTASVNLIKNPIKENNREYVAEATVELNDLTQISGFFVFIEINSGAKLVEFPRYIVPGWGNNNGLFLGCELYDRIRDLILATYNCKFCEQFYLIDFNDSHYDAIHGTRQDVTDYMILKAANIYKCSKIMFHIYEQNDERGCTVFLADADNKNVGSARLLTEPISAKKAIEDEKSRHGELYGRSFDNYLRLSRSLDTQKLPFVTK